MLKNRHTVLITGGTAGIGLALARQLLASGTQVLVTGRSPERLAQALESCPGLDGIPSDITCPEDRQRLRQWIEQNHPSLDILINNAGMGGGCLFAHSADAADQIEGEIQVNLLAPIHLTHELLPILQRNSPGCIVNVTSGYALWPCNAAPGYSASKAGFSAFTHALHEQLREENIHVMEACPPMVATAMVADVRVKKMTPEKTAQVILRGMEKKKRRVLIGPCSTLEVARRFSPSLTRFVLNRYPVSFAEFKKSNQA